MKLPFFLKKANRTRRDLPQFSGWNYYGIWHDIHFFQGYSQASDTERIAFLRFIKKLLKEDIQNDNFSKPLRQMYLNAKNRDGCFSVFPVSLTEDVKPCKTIEAMPLEGKTVAVFPYDMRFMPGQYFPELNLAIVGNRRYDCVAAAALNKFCRDNIYSAKMEVYRLTDAFEFLHAKGGHWEIKTHKIKWSIPISDPRFALLYEAEREIRSIQNPGVSP